MTDTRTLQFPTDRSLGLLIINHDGDTQTAPARGEVSVPAAAQLGVVPTEVRQG